MALLLEGSGKTVDKRPPAVAVQVNIGATLPMERWQQNAGSYYDPSQWTVEASAEHAREGGEAPPRGR